MRGSKFRRLSIIMILAVVTFGVAGIFAFWPNKITVKAEDNSIYNRTDVSQQYQDDVIMSAEKVYYDYENRNYSESDKSDLVKDDNSVHDILGLSNAHNYFADISNDTGSKSIIYDGDFVMLDEGAAKTFNGDGATSWKQGVMFTIGGYVRDGINLRTNSMSNGESENKFASQLQSLSVSIKRNGTEIVSQDDNKPSLRTYQLGNQTYFDFVHFFDAKKENEGYYEVRFSYMQVGGETQTHTFNFYILLKSSYNGSVSVNGVSYSSNPTLSHADGGVSTTNPKDNQYPVLTYDYKHYDLAFTYTENDSITSAVLRYESSQNGDHIVLESENAGTRTATSYAVENNNNIISLFFASKGQYVFRFSYVYYYNDSRLSIDNLTMDNIRLSINGYEMKYAKNGYTSSDMRYMEIVKNGTMLIPFNGYTEGNIPAEKSGKDIGYRYVIVAPDGDKTSTEKTTGYVKTLKTTDVTNLVKTSEELDSEGAKIAYDTGSKKFTSMIEASQVVNTDQGGVWLTLSNYYKLGSLGVDSYYIYSPSMFNTTDTYTQSSFTKSTTFTRSGYYFVKVKYGPNSGNSEGVTEQYFLFRLSSATASVRLYATNSDVVPDTEVAGTRLYSNQFTNKNVFGAWKDPDVFESTQTATLFYGRDGGTKYFSKDAMINHANGRTNAQIQSKVFDKKTTILKDSGSYLILVQIQGSQSKAYYYFNIDKEDISGIETLGVSSASLGDSVVYNVATNTNGEAVTYTQNGLIDRDFTLWWDDKLSGAKITGTYTFTPFVYNGIIEEKTISQGSEQSHWLSTPYGLTNTSNKISISKPITKNSIVEASNVLTKQGIYWFTLTDEAGNVMNYAVVIDKTEATIQVKTQSGNSVEPNEMVAEDVTVEWGTHKSIRLSPKDGEKQDSKTTSLLDTLKKVFIDSNDNTIKYYKANNKSNYNSLKATLQIDRSESKDDLYFAIKNKYLEISKSMTETMRIDSNGSYTNKFENVELTNGHHATIKLTSENINYLISLYGENQISDSNNLSTFNVRLNADKSEGRIVSKTEEEDISFKEVSPYANNENEFKEKLEKDFANINAQATSDTFLFFEWKSGQGTDYAVSEISYKYYPFMTQTEMNEYKKNDDTYKYYPFSSTATEYQIMGGNSNAHNYVEVSGTSGDTLCRSNVLNAGYVLMYDANGHLISHNATLPGMYVITRTYEKEITESSLDAKTRSYVFFVDRNNIIQYSTTDIGEKLVGSYIDLLIQENIEFSSFMQEVETNNGEKIHLKSNRLPLELRVPTGKYATKVTINGTSTLVTSNSYSGGIKLNVQFIDQFNYLGQNRIVSGAEQKLRFTLFNMSQMQLTTSSYDREGYITFKLDYNTLSKDNLGSEGYINNYLNACYEKGKTWLSLPGIYVLTITDNVGTERDVGGWSFEDAHSMKIGVMIEQNKPTLTAYASKSTETASTTADVIYANFKTNGNQFSTSKAYVRYELPKSSETSYNAQIDPNYINITRTDESGKSEVYYSSVTNSGVIDKDQQIVTGIKYIQELNDKFVIWLDTGIVVDSDNRITDYREYIYDIEVRYILGDSDKYINSYRYKKLNGAEFTDVDYYSEHFIVRIDRTADTTNLKDILGETNANRMSQTEFFEEYLRYLNDASYDLTGKFADSIIYNTIAYRGDGEDYYAVVNKLYYALVDAGRYAEAERAIYPIKVGLEDRTKFNSADIYYRPLYTNSEGQVSDEDKRMALLPICQTYYNNLNGFKTFSWNSTEGFTKVTNSSQLNWRNALNLSENRYGYYEIIEVDESKNYTQYVVYVAPTTADEDNLSDINPRLVFKDISSDDAGEEFVFNFAYDLNNELNFYTQAELNALSNTVSLQKFKSVEDMFGNLYESTSMAGSNEEFRDYVFKASLKYQQSEDIFYLTFNDHNLAKFLGEKMSQFETQNFILTLTNRYNQTITLNINLTSEDHTLNINELSAKEDVNGKWFLDWQGINLNNDGVYYYAKEIEVTDLSDNNKVSRYTVDFTITDNVPSLSLKQNGNPVDRIELASGHDFSVRVTDIAGKTYQVRVKSYDSGSTDYSIEIYGDRNYTISENVYYTANPVEITYNKDIYSSARLTIYRDGEVIYSDAFNFESANQFKSLEISGYKYAEYLGVNTRNSKLTSIRFYPYVDGISSTLRSGAKLEYTFDLIYANASEKSYSFVLDNRQPNITLTNTRGEAKSNSIQASYNYSNERDLSLQIVEEDLFDLSPSMIISETVVLGFSDVRNIRYINSYETEYYSVVLNLYEFTSKDNFILTNLLDISYNYVNISPKDNSLGRYVVLFELLNTEGKIVAYKTFAFNVSSTSSSMFEVQNSNGEIVNHNSSIMGSEIVNILTNTAATTTSGNAIETFKNVLGFNTNASELTRFSNLNIPMYISNAELKVIPNGDSNVQVTEFEITNKEFTLHIYKVYSRAYTTYLVVLNVAETNSVLPENETDSLQFIPLEGSGNTLVDLFASSRELVSFYGNIVWTYYNTRSLETDSSWLTLAMKNSIYLDIYYMLSENNEVYLGSFYGQNVLSEGVATTKNYLPFNTTGTYRIYVKDKAGNSRVWQTNTINESASLVLGVSPEMNILVNDESPVDYAYYNGEVTVSVGFINSGYYDSGSVKMFAYYNGSTEDYITTRGGRRTNFISSFTFTEYGTYRVLISATRQKKAISKVYTFTILNPSEARLALDFTLISRYQIQSVINETTGQNVTSTFNFLINEGFIYSKLITYTRLSAENAFGSTMGKQTFVVTYLVHDNPLLPERTLTFAFTINNQMPSLTSSVDPEGSTTKNITIKYNPQTIYRQVGDCYIMVNDAIVASINEENASNNTFTITLSNVGDYYIKIVSDSGRVMSSFKVTIKEPLNAWSIILIVAAVLLVIGLVVVFIVLRTRMKVK